MSTKMTEKKQQSLQSKRARIIYERIKDAYKYKSLKELGEELGIGKSGMSQRIKRGTLDEDELLIKFPDLNEEWLKCEDLDALRRLPVRGSEIKAVDDSEVDVGKNQLSFDSRLELVEQIESLLKILKGSL